MWYYCEKQSGAASIMLMELSKTNFLLNLTPCGALKYFCFQYPNAGFTNRFNTSMKSLTEYVLYDRIFANDWKILSGKLVPTVFYVQCFCVLPSKIGSRNCHNPLMKCAK